MHLFFSSQIKFTSGLQLIGDVVYASLLFLLLLYCVTCSVHKSLPPLQYNMSSSDEVITGMHKVRSIVFNNNILLFIVYINS